LGKPYWFCRHCYQEMPFGETVLEPELGLPQGLRSDITDRKWTQEALWENQELARRIVETTMEGIWVLDPSGKTTFVNRRMADMLGYTVEEMQGQPLFAFMDAECQAIAQTNLERHRGGIEEQLDFKFRRRDGKDLWAIVVTHSLLDEAGQYAGALGIIIDITERKRMEEALRQKVEELEQADRLKDEFLAIVSHELRTPLNAILSWSELLLTRNLNEATRDRALEIIQRNGRLQNQLIEDLIDIERMIRGKVRLNTSSIDLIPVIESAIETVRPAAQAKAIQIECFLDPSVDQILGDSDRLQQVVWNLLSNAIKFTPVGERVEVRLQRVGSNAQIQVKDRGIGISADFLPYVFDPFRQGDSNSRRQQDGLGLGLAIVRQLVELHNGNVHVASDGEGKGATFTVQLPLLLPRSESEESTLSSRWHSHTSTDLLQSYVAYYLSRGKTVISPRFDAISFEGSVYEYWGYHSDFQDFWKQLASRRDFRELYLEGEIYSFGDFLGESCTVGECARCQLPIPMSSGHAYTVPNCTLCDDLLMSQKAQAYSEPQDFEEELEVTRVLAIGTPPTDYKTLQKLFSLNGFEVMFISKPEDVTPPSLPRAVDMVLIYAEVSEAEGQAWARELRRHPQIQHVPIVALSAKAGHGHPWIERTLRVEDYLLVPLGGEHLAHRLARLLPFEPSSYTDALHWFPR
jgi:PAS domain S-box-containing protein